MWYFRVPLLQVYFQRLSKDCVLCLYSHNDPFESTAWAGPETNVFMKCSYANVRFLVFFFE